MLQMQGQMTLQQAQLAQQQQNVQRQQQQAASIAAAQASLQAQQAAQQAQQQVKMSTLFEYNCVVLGHNYTYLLMFASRTHNRWVVAWVSF